MCNNTLQIGTTSLHRYYMTENKYQLADEKAYYVHHMSMFEHFNHKHHGFGVASKRMLTMAEAAYRGECGALNEVNASRSFLGLVPFYGGRPPNVTEDLTVKSLGQGNSLVRCRSRIDFSYKLYFDSYSPCAGGCVNKGLAVYGHSVLLTALLRSGGDRCRTSGRSPSHDRNGDFLPPNYSPTIRFCNHNLFFRQLDKMDSAISRHVDVLHFDTLLPAHLPFNLLAWAQTYAQQHNCNGLKRRMRDDQRTAPPDIVPSKAQRKLKENSDTDLNPKPKPKPKSKPKPEKMPLSNPQQTQSPFRSLTTSGAQWMAQRGIDQSTYSICDVNFGKHHYGKKHFAVIHHRKSAFYEEREEAFETLSSFDTSQSKGSDSRSNIGSVSVGVGGAVHVPVKYVYYTECDQVLRFEDAATFGAVSAVSSNVTFITGRRREKDFDSSPTDYMGGTVLVTHAPKNACFCCFVRCHLMHGCLRSLAGLTSGRPCGEGGYLLDIEPPTIRSGLVSDPTCFSGSKC